MINTSLPVFKRSFLYISLILFLLQNISAQTTATINNRLLKSYDAAFSARITQYNNSRYNVVTNQTKSPLTASIQLQSFLQSKWQITTLTKSVKNEINATDYTVTFKCIQGQLKQASVSIDIEFSHWNTKNYVLMPSAAYNGNRYEWRRLRYSPKLYEVQDIGIDKPIIVTDIPKLSESEGVSRIQERIGSMSTPGIGFIADSLKKGLWLLTRQKNSFGDYGIGIEESRNRQQATISITSPVVRELFVYKSCDAHYPSWDTPKDFKAGDTITISFRLYGFEAPETQSLFNKFATIRKQYETDTTLVNSLSYSSCMELLEQKFNEKNWVDKYGYYSIGFRENFLQDWQIGWTGGMISTYPLLFAGNEQTKKNVLKNFDWLFPNGISPSGFYYDAGRNGTEWIAGDIRKPQSKNWHLVRKSGDAVWYILKQFMLMEKQGITVKQSWKEGNQKVCDAFVKLWNKYHQLGQFVDAYTGDIAVGGSSGGGIVPAALTLASAYYHQPEYLETAKAIAAYYNENFTKKGITCGGPGDALQNFDSESSYGLVESYTTIYEVTKEKQYLQMAENAAKQFATWVVSYNYKFIDTTAYAKANIHTTGSVYANTQNKHTAPGICTASGIALLKLYRFTGNVFYINLLHDIAHNITQYLPHPKKPLGNAYFGWVSERINMTDWEGLENIGYVLPLSTWAETSLMLTTIEIPGLYIQPKNNFFRAFDNVIVTVLSSTKDELKLLIKNPTPVDANLSILEDNDTHIALNENALFGGRKLFIKAGETKELSFKR